VNCEERVTDIEEWTRFIKVICKYCGNIEKIKYTNDKYENVGQMSDTQVLAKIIDIIYENVGQMSDTQVLAKIIDIIHECVIEHKINNDDAIDNIVHLLIKNKRRQPK